ncbi:MAG: SUF system NifU family Fe-S cluster assembly protein [Dehalococcoidia bacterium]|nr:SUF system NifU family Fe-S cluster assembly protein [Dehalococcoidia bacterium]
MSSLQDLYQDIVIDHNSRPRNFRKPQGATRSVEGYNPLCGDRYTLHVQVDGDLVCDIGFEGSGCAISKASTSMMTEAVKGRPKGHAADLFDSFQRMLVRPPGAEFDPDEVGDLEALSGVNEYPARVKCAILSWHTLRAALDGGVDSVTTE